MGIAVVVLITSVTGRADDGGASAAVSPQISVRSDPLFERSFLELPVPAAELGKNDPEAELRNPKHRLRAHRLRTGLDERRIEELWHLRSTNETVLDFRADLRLSNYGPNWVFFDPLWCWGPESTWWILYGPGTVQRWDDTFPEFGRHHPAAFFRPPGTLPTERWNRVQLSPAEPVAPPPNAPPSGRDPETASKPPPTRP